MEGEAASGHFLSPCYGSEGTRAPLCGLLRPPAAWPVQHPKLKELTVTTKLDVRLLGAERDLLIRLQEAMATPLRPRVTSADVIRAGLIALRDRLAVHGGQGAQ